jgi:hypothetical protein
MCSRVKADSPIRPPQLEQQAIHSTLQDDSRYSAAPRLSGKLNFNWIPTALRPFRKLTVDNLIRTD